MKVRVTAAAGLLLLTAASTWAQEGPTPREEAARKELLKFQGTWSFASFEDGKKTPQPNLKKRTFFVGGSVFLVREGDKVIQAGTLRLSPAKSPKTIDAVVRKGDHEGNTMLGIYELTGDTLKVCFDPEGDGRPKKFAVKAGSDLFLAVYKRVKPPDEAVDIVGRYKSTATGPDGARQTATAEIQRHGDAYLVRWNVGPALAYVGVGIRKANTLSVAWTNRGTVGVSVYEIEKGPKLIGTFTDLGGPGLMSREVLTVPEAPVREARRPGVPPAGPPLAGRPRR
jgi:uncharacterized protein (TIGR03067 family)